MKKIILLLSIFLISMTSFAQKKVVEKAQIKSTPKVEVTQIIPHILLENQPEKIQEIGIGEAPEDAIYSPVGNGAAKSFTEYPANFIGGREAMIKFIDENINYPKELYQNPIEGEIEVFFRIGVDGTLSNFSVRNSSSPNNEYLVAEAIRVTSIMPKWSPRFYNNEYKEDTGSVTIVFKIKIK